jgi:hypothetical protein
VQFTVLFARNVERDLVADENRRDLRWFLAGAGLRRIEVPLPVRIEITEL